MSIIALAQDADFSIEEKHANLDLEIADINKEEQQQTV